jgi:antitoxin FitA
MANITVCNLDDEVLQRLKQKAAAHGRSMEAEARSILIAALNRGGSRMLASRFMRTRGVPNGKGQTNRVWREARRRGTVRSFEAARSAVNGCWFAGPASAIEFPLPTSGDPAATVVVPL